MPEFILKTPPTRADIARARAYGYRPARPVKPHPFHDLSEFAQGYVEAMFFTNGDIGDDRENLLNEWGAGRLTRRAIDSIAADCAAFEKANAADLDAAKALEPGSDEFRYAREPLDDRRCGHLFWYARQGHGVGWTDDGDAECLARLQDACRAFGEAYVDAWRGWIHHR